MTQLRRWEHSRYSVRQLYELVADVARYPEFLPWCRAARILSRESETAFRAELVIAFRGMSERYSSQVTLTPPPAAAAITGEARILAEMVEGPFHHLTNLWTLTPAPEGGTDITLELDFRFKSKILDSLIGGLFAAASEKMISAFRQRARMLYGEPATPLQANNPPDPAGDAG